MSNLYRFAETEYASIPKLGLTCLMMFFINLSQSPLVNFISLASISQALLTVVSSKVLLPFPKGALWATFIIFLICEELMGKLISSTFLIFNPGKRNEWLPW
ncbi:MAG TPA: hypothetical protein VNE41_06985 [Chitinophagaceae bacterium]|nr:hypothetical protein [Chitinophagaceae bacterium]